MPRGKKATIRYGKAARSPSKRASEPRVHPSHFPQMKKPKGLSEIAEYVEENSEYHDGSTIATVREFQVEQCDHTKQRVVVADGPTKTLLKCPDCGDIQEKLKK